MIVKVWDWRKDAERVLMLRLAANDSDGVDLVAVDEDGKRLPCGCLLRITREGKLDPCQNISNAIGIPLDANGSMLIV